MGALWPFLTFGLTIRLGKTVSSGAVIGFDVARGILFAWPLFWILCLLLAWREAKGRNRPATLRRIAYSTILPLAAYLAELLLLLAIT